MGLDAPGASIIWAPNGPRLARCNRGYLAHGSDGRRFVLNDCIRLYQWLKLGARRSALTCPSA